MQRIHPRQPAPKAEPKPLADAEQQTAWIVVTVLVVLCVYAYLNSLRLVVGSWNDPQYSHGFLIPLGAIGLLWWQRKQFVPAQMWERWLGVALIGMAVVVRVISAHYTRFSPDNLSMIPCLMGVFLIVGGWRSLRWAGLPILFLLFMFPWPDRLERLILVGLKEHAAMPISLFTLQALGVEAYLSGNVIELGDGTKMNVVDACAGLGMLNIFLALAAAFAMLATDRPAWERIVLFLSAVPIALASNALRITVEGLIYYYGPSVLGADSVVWWAKLFHDWAASWFMMIVALGLLYLEYCILTRLVIEEDSHQSLKGHLNAPTR